MGVAGLWSIIRPAGKTRSLTELSIVEGFQANPDGVRGFRIGIDASIWFVHAEYGREGENPVLRTLFFRCATLMHSPFLPLFVFDGPKRPDWKRGKKINKTSHKLIPGMKAIIESFGFEWRMAPGEAEAELAYLNRIGLIDGILSDDVDNFLFGALTVIRNPSNNLSGNRTDPVLNAAGKDDKNHTKVYRMSDITAHPDISLTRGGMILIGLLSGGDYQQGGLNGCGTITAHGLAKCSFGDTLIEAAESMTREALKTFLVTWRHDLSHELRTNSKGYIGRKQAALAKSIPDDFPNIDVLLSYINPITSESLGRTESNLRLTWAREPDLGKLAATCEFYFEWGYKEAIIKRFRTVIWPSAVLRILRRAVLGIDHKKQSETFSASLPTTPKKRHKPSQSAPGTPSKMIAEHFSSMDLSNGLDSEDEADDKPLIVKIHSERKHVSTDGILEYRLEIAPEQLVRLAESGIKGTRFPEAPDEWADKEDDDEDADIKKTLSPKTHIRVWMPACMVQMVEPRLVEEYEAQQQRKRDRKAGKGTGKAKKTSAPVAPLKFTSGPHGLPAFKPLPIKEIRPSGQVTAREVLLPDSELHNSRLSKPMDNFPSVNVGIKGDRRSKSSNSRANLSQREVIDNAGGHDGDELLNDMLVSPTKPSRLALWNAPPKSAYIAVSDSDDDTKGGHFTKAKLASVLLQDESYLYDSDSSHDKYPLLDFPPHARSKQCPNHSSLVPDSDPYQHFNGKSSPKPHKLNTRKLKNGKSIVSSASRSNTAINAPARLPSDARFTIIELSDSEPEFPSTRPGALPSVQDTVGAQNRDYARHPMGKRPEGRKLIQDMIDLT